MKTATSDMESIRNRVLENLRRLPEPDLKEVLSFTEYILTKREKEQPTQKTKELDPKKDPILKLIGMADVEPFAEIIEQELYGQ
ncbi:MAG: hypothetical protein V1736_03430 [Pseudomonadota bacterium]